MKLNYCDEDSEYIPRFGKYLICGGAGFIGSNISKYLISCGKSVTVIDNLSTGAVGNLDNILNLPNFKFIEADLLEYEGLEEEVKSCDFVFNFAAKVGVDLVLSEPTQVIMSNILIANKLCNYCYTHSKPIFLSSSSEVYGKNVRDSLIEEDLSYIASPKLLRWSYSVSKIAEEFIARDFKRKGLQVLIGRFFNIVGPHQNKTYGFVIPKFIHQARNAQNITVYGNGSQRRAFCDIRDLIGGLAALISKFDELALQDDIEYNIGNDTDIDIYSLAQKVINLCKSNSEIRYVHIDEMPEGFDEIPKRLPCIDKIKTATGWQPKYQLNDTLEFILSKC